MNPEDLPAAFASMTAEDQKGYQNDLCCFGTAIMKQQEDGRYICIPLNVYLKKKEEDQ